MDIATRQAITDIAARTRTTLVVDETMVDLWFEAPPPPPLASFNQQATVITPVRREKFLGWAAPRLDPRLVAHHCHTCPDAGYAGFRLAAAGTAGHAVAYQQ